FLRGCLSSLGWLFRLKLQLKHVFDKITPKDCDLHGLAPLLGILLTTAESTLRGCPSKTGASMPCIRDPHHECSWAGLWSSVGDILYKKEYFSLLPSFDPFLYCGSFHQLSPLLE